MARLAYWKPALGDHRQPRNRNPQPVITAVAPPYAFDVSLTWGTAATPGGQLQIGASSVCLWPHGAPSPGE